MVWLVVDALLGMVFGVAGFLVRLFPQGNPFEGAELFGTGGGPMMVFGNVVFFINHVLPLVEFFQVLAVLVPIWLLVVLVRFLISLIPTIG